MILPMPHSSHDVFAKFDEEIRFYKGTPVMAYTQDFYETGITRGFVRGFPLNAPREPFLPNL